VSIVLKNRIYVLIALLAMLVPVGAGAQTVVAGPEVYTITDDGGQFTVQKTATAYDDGAGVFRYVYVLESLSGDPICGFKLNIPDTLVSTASWVAGTGVEPISATIGATETEFLFGPSADPFNCLSTFGVPFVGAVSAELEITSTFGPGSVGDTITVSINSFQGFDEPGQSLGPQVPPVECDLAVVKEGCVVQPPDPGGDTCEGKLVSFDFEYTGLGCDATSHLQNPRKVKCIGGADGAEPVEILFYKKEHKRRKWHRHGKKSLFASFQDVNVGDVLTVDAADAGRRHLRSDTYVKIRDAAGVVEKVKFHTSCSQPLGPGNQFGSIKITSLTSTRGGTCADTLTSQDSAKYGCSENSALPADPVRIVIKTGDHCGVQTYLDGPVEVGGFVTVAPSVIGRTELTCTTAYELRDATTDELIQEGYFHTSCSQPLDLGNQFGALQVFSMETTQGGSVSLGGDVDYTYTVTNPNAETVDNVSVEDDKLGSIASGVSIAAYESAVFTASAFIFEDTTNIVTVSGDVGGVQCDEASDNLTITVEEPPDPGSICTTKVKAMLLQYTGPPMAGPVTIELVADTFSYDPVSITLPDGLATGDVVTIPGENGFTIDAMAHSTGCYCGGCIKDLGPKTTISINGVSEVIHTSCSTPFVKDAPAPLNNPIGDPSPNWLVVDFTQK